MPNAGLFSFGGPQQWHFLFESLAYMLAFAYYNRSRKQHGDILPATQRSSIIVAAILGAAVGSKFLACLENPDQLISHLQDPAYFMAGKTVVGAILGGTITVELVKKYLGIHQRTGDLFALPLVIGISIGRIGCFLAGLDDHTFGTPTSLPWGVDFGDGIARHPTQLYEIAAMLPLGFFLHRFNRTPHQTGDSFRLFVFVYLLWRLLVDFLKPDPRFAGLSVIQWTCLLGIAWYSRDILRILLTSPEPSPV